MTRKNTNETNVLILLPTLTIHVPTNKGTVIGSHFCAQNAVKGLSRYSRGNVTWMQMSAMTKQCYLCKAQRFELVFLSYNNFIVC